MNKKTLLSLSVAAVLLTLLVVACAKKINAKKESVADTTEIPVKLTAATTETLSEPVIASGFISSATEARLSFKTGGVIQKVYADESDVIRKGQLLATLNLTEINTLVEQAKLGLDKAQRDFDRVQNLYRDTVASLEQLQNVTTALNVARQQYEQALFNRTYSEIRAPHDGKVIKKLANEGEIIGAGMPVFFTTGAGTNDWVVKVGIADKDWARLKVGNTATIAIDAYKGETFTATVSQLAQAPDPMSSLYEVELKLKPTGKPIATGLFAKAQIKPQGSSTYVTVPVDALVEGNGNQAFVFVIENGKAVKQPVLVAFLQNGKAMLSGGINEGTPVVTAGSAYLTHGTPAKVIE